MIILQIILCIIITDLLTGTVHWWEDTYGNPDWKFFGNSIVKPNIEHHKKPRRFLKDTLRQRIQLSALIAIGIGTVIFFLGFLNWQIIFCLVYASFANEIHAITHRTNKENGKLICLIQKTGLIQSRKMHGYHHSAPFDVNYCILTNYLNPILNKIKFWIIIEWIIGVFGIKSTRNNKNRAGY
jgi:hypothetical protein